MLTPEQKEERKKFLGSSDAPAIVGVDPSRTPYDVWADKANQIERREPKGNRAMDAGLVLEDSVLRWAEMKLERPIVRDLQGRAGRMILHPNGIMAANLDGIILDGEPAIVEAKTSGIVGHLRWDDWGEEDSEDVPDRVLAQVAHQFAVVRASMELDVRTAYVPALLGGRGFVMFQLRYVPELVEGIVEAEESFWRKHVVTKIAPEDLPSFSTLRALRRVPDKVAEIPNEIVLEWKDKKALEQLAKQAKEDAERTLLLAFGDAEVAEWEGGVITYRKQIRKEHLVPESAFRSLREGKKKKEQKS